MCQDAGDCCRTTAKVLLIIINLLFFLLGLLMLAFGIALVAAPGKCINAISSLGENDFDYFKDASDGYIIDLVRAVGIFMIVLGGVVAIIAFFGFFGACCENRCMLITYVVILIIIVLAEVALIIFAAVFPDKFEKTGKKALYDSLAKNAIRFESDFNVTGSSFKDSSVGKGEATWNGLQWALKCCGAYDYTDYANFTWTKATCDGSPCSTPQVVPLSCCKRKDTSKPPETLNDYVDYRSCLATADASSTNRKGCGDATKDLIKDYGKIAIGIAAGIVGLELILITLALIMACMWADRSGKYV